MDPTFLNRDPNYPTGEILIDPTIEQSTDARARGLNPEAGRALLSLAGQGKLNVTELDMIDRAWDQLAVETDFPVKECVEYDPTKLPSQVGVFDTITFRDRS